MSRNTKSKSWRDLIDEANGSIYEAMEKYFKKTGKIFPRTPYHLLLEIRDAAPLNSNLKHALIVRIKELD